jgi:hypothetical protein
MMMVVTAMFNDGDSGGMMVMVMVVVMMAMELRGDELSLTSSTKWNINTL